MKAALGDFTLNRAALGDAMDLMQRLPDASIDILVTSPPYWGQRLSAGMGTEPDPRVYLTFLEKLFIHALPKLKPHGIMWINLGDAYNTPVNWRLNDRQYSTLGADRTGLSQDNSAYTKPRAQRKAFVEQDSGWLTYGNLLALPTRLIIALSDRGFLYRGEVIWRKRNPMPEGRCRRPHRQHESIYLLAKNEDHQFRVAPPVGSVWEFSNEKINGPVHVDCR